MEEDSTRQGIEIEIQDYALPNIEKMKRKIRSEAYHTASSQVDKGIRSLTNEIEEQLTKIYNKAVKKSIVQSKGKIARKTKRELKMHTPYDESPIRENEPHLRDSIIIKYEQGSKRNWEKIFVGWEDPEQAAKAKFTNAGTEPHDIKGNDLLVWSVEKSEIQYNLPTYNGYYVVDGVLHHPGFKGRHFIDKTRQNMPREIRKIIKADIKKNLDAIK